MSEEYDYVLNIALPKKVAGALESEPVDGVHIDSVRADEEQASKFGLAEAVVVITLVKGLMEVVKLALEIRKKLAEEEAAGKKEQSAVMSTPAGNINLVITGSQTPEELEAQVRAALAAAA